jgi:phosphatidylserine/phosphatidylglycerophosphate/cardiolipin synthase-like enzyme
VTERADEVASGTYFPESTPGCPTFLHDSEWYPLIDGSAYFSLLDEELTDLGPGDSVLISGLDIDPSIDLCGRDPDAPGYLALGERLARAAANGAQVRVLIAGKVAARSLPLPSLAEFRGSVRHADQLRGWRPRQSSSTDAPLADSVLVDWSGPLVGSNHQKVAVVGRGGTVTAFVGGIDLVPDRFDAAPHDRLRLDDDRWGWHDCAVRLRGPAAARVHDIIAVRWHEAASLPRRLFPRRRPFRLTPLNPVRAARTPDAASPQEPLHSPDVAIRVMRSLPSRKIDSLLPGRRQSWSRLPSSGFREIHETIVHALAQARRYVYVEDQYLEEFLGGDDEYELYPHVREAARRGAKVIMVGSGVRDPEDPGLYLRGINRGLNRDLQRKVVKPLRGDDARFVVTRVEHLTVHAKIVLVDDAFACIGSANMFSRSMVGTDSEMATAVATSSDLVRDLRVQLWAEHLRTPVTPDLRERLRDLDVALGIWRPEWLPHGCPPTTWRKTGSPPGFQPIESVMRTVWPE